MTLAELKIGQDAVLRTIGGQGELRHHLLDMGLTPGTEVTLRKIAPMGDPIEVELRGYELTLRLADAAKIEVENVHETDRAARSEERHAPVPHPGVGELRKAPSYHDRKAGAEIAKGQPLHLALAGNQNCGKTTLFNQLTGSNQHVGNFPGVTVDRKDGTIRGHEEATVTDLPGIYSLSPYSSEEIVTRDFLLNTHPDAIINIVDASNIERNLYLTMQLMELNIPLVLALCACAFATFIEMGKLPFDLAEAEQELQEGPLSEYSGSGFGVMKWGISLKQLVVLQMFVGVFIPWGQMETFTAGGLLLALVIAIVKLVVGVLVIALFENSMARLRLDISPRITWAGFGFAFLAFVSLLAA